MSRNLNLNALRVFAMAARHGSFQRAAEALHISHGAVSQRIKQLELDLGVILFDRHPRGVTLTPKGAAYFTTVDAALTQLAKATADLQGTDNQITLHLGASFVSKWLMPRLQDFNDRFPDIAIATEVHDTLLTRSLGRNELAFWPAKTPQGQADDHIQHLCELQLTAVCSPSLLRPDWPPDIETLLTFPLLQDAHKRWERLIAQTDPAGTHRLLNFDRSALALDAAIHGHGIAIAPTLMVERDVQQNRLVELWHSPEPSGEHLFLSWPKHHARDKALRQTIGWILGEFNQAAPNA